MAGILVVREGAVWTVSNAAYEYLTKAVAAELADASEPVPAAVADAAPAYPGDGGDWRSLRPDELRRVHRALGRLMARLFAAGPGALAAPEAFAPLLALLSGLKAMLASDPRLALRRRRQVALRINAGATWRSAGWLARMLLEQVAARTLPDDGRLARDLLGASATLDPARLTLAHLDSRRFGVVTLDVEAIARHLAAPARAPGDTFHRAAQRGCGHLHTMLRRDPRAWGRADADIVVPLRALPAAGGPGPPASPGPGAQLRRHGRAVLLSRPANADAADSPAPFGCFLAEPHRPREDQARIYRLEWDPETGGEADVRREAAALATRRDD